MIRSSLGMDASFNRRREKLHRSFFPVQRPTREGGPKRFPRSSGVVERGVLTFHQDTPNGRRQMPLPASTIDEKKRGEGEHCLVAVRCGVELPSFNQEKVSGWEACQPRELVVELDFRPFLSRVYLVSLISSREVFSQPQDE